MIVKTKRVTRILFLSAILASLTACSTMGVEPWERDLLAKDSMQLAPDYFDNFYDEHIYFSKEATSGGQGVGGGGCGCN